MGLDYQLRARTIPESLDREMSAAYCIWRPPQVSESMDHALIVHKLGGREQVCRLLADTDHESPTRYIVLIELLFVQTLFPDPGRVSADRSHLQSQRRTPYSPMFPEHVTTRDGGVDHQMQHVFSMVHWELDADSPGSSRSIARCGLAVRLCAVELREAWHVSKISPGFDKAARSQLLRKHTSK